MTEKPGDSGPPASSAPGRPSLRELALLFLRLGATAFGGPAAHIALMEDEVVRRRRWLSRAEFLDLLGATNLIPGPNSTEMAIHVGLLAGWAGLVVAGVCFLLPAVILVTLLAWVYVQWHGLPQVAGVLYGVKPVVIAVVVQALWRLGWTSIKTPLLAGVAGLAVAATILNVDELIVLLAAGVVVAVAEWLRDRAWRAALLPALGLTATAASGAGATAAFSLGSLFLVFLKIGSVLFGSGYVLLAFLRSDFVERRHWLTENQLLDAVAVGQVTPGPLFTTATFIGYVLGGLPGAAVATVGIFLPAFVFVAISGPLVPRLRRSRTAGAFLDGVVAASLALMAVVTWELARAALVDFPTALLAAVSALLLMRYRVNSLWLMLGGAAAGLLLAWRR
jgi:chromate transporter